MYKCYKCDKMFETLEAKNSHKLDKHQPHRRFGSRDRPRQRGTVPCGYPMCDATFSAEFNAIQHRRDVHGESPPWDGAS